MEQWVTAISLIEEKSSKYVLKEKLFLDSSRSTSTQTIVNNVNNNADECKAEVIDNDSDRDSDRDSMHSIWSKLMPIKSGMNKNASTSDEEVMKINSQPRKRAIKNIVLVPYKPKPKDWGSWKVKSAYANSTIASPPLISNDQNQNKEMVYVPHSPYYSPVHPPEFYGDE